MIYVILILISFATIQLFKRRFWNPAIPIVLESFSDTKSELLFIKVAIKTIWVLHYITIAFSLYMVISPSRLMYEPISITHPIVWVYKLQLITMLGLWAIKLMADVKLSESK